VFSIPKNPKYRLLFSKFSKFSEINVVLFNVTSNFFGAVLDAPTLGYQEDYGKEPNHLILPPWLQVAL
jgi:hypothetical protein